MRRAKCSAVQHMPRFWCAIHNNCVMRIIVVGAGTVGTATGAGLEKLGHTVQFVERSRERIAQLRKDGLEVTTPEKMALNGVDAIFVSVNTPSGEHGIDATDLLAATENIGIKLKELRDGTFPLVVFRSTQPPGTTRNSLIPLLQNVSGKKVNTDFGVTYWPEYLRAFNAEDDFNKPRVITLSTLEKHDKSHTIAAGIALDLQAAIHWIPLEAAELQKYVHNVGNAIKISTYNWFRLLAEKIGLEQEDIEHVFELCTISAEGLWNPNYGLKDLGPYSGACLPKDITALRGFAATAGIDTSLLDAAESINNEIRKT